MTRHTLPSCAFAALTLACLSAQAFPIAAPGTEGLRVIATGGEVKATYQGTSAAYSDDLRLQNTDPFTFVFNNQANSPGDTVSLGTFAPGTELVFLLFVQNTENGFFSGPASRNSKTDGQAHARVQADWEPGTTLVSFEDLYNGPFDYNDLSFSFTNTAAAVAEPPITALVLAGLGVIGVVARRRLDPAAQRISLPA